jgi:hypothetical protein
MPAFAVVLMRSLNMVQSIALDVRQDRIAPYIITGIFYLWIFINFKNNQLIPKPLTITVLGATIGLFIAFFFNNFTKISAHAVGMGGMVGMAVVNTLYFNFDTFTLSFPWLGAFEISTNFVLMTVILLAGMVCTARLYLQAHTQGQVYGGFAVGLLAQFVALLFLK